MQFHEFFFLDFFKFSCPLCIPELLERELLLPTTQYCSSFLSIEKFRGAQPSVVSLCNTSFPFWDNAPSFLQQEFSSSSTTHTYKTLTLSSGNNNNEPDQEQTAPHLQRVSPLWPSVFLPLFSRENKIYRLVKNTLKKFQCFVDKKKS